LQDPPPAGLGAADALLVRRPIDRAGGRDAVRVGLAELERVEAIGRLAGPVARPGLDAVRGRIEQLVQALDLVRRERGQDVIAGVADRVADPDAQPAELLGCELVDDGAQAVVAAVAAGLPEAELAERQGEVVGHDQDVGERRVLTDHDLAHREPGIVHVGQRLDEGEVEPVIPAPDDARRVALAPAAVPTGPLREPIHDQPADVVTGAGIPGSRVAEPHDDLHDASADSTMWPRSPAGATRVAGSGGWAESDGTRADDGAPPRGRSQGAGCGSGWAGTSGSPSSTRSRARIAAPSTGSAWSQPHTWSVPCVTSSRSSSAADQRVVPP
jgi:hypothetical protein